MYEAASRERSDNGVKRDKEREVKARLLYSTSNEVPNTYYKVAETVRAQPSNLNSNQLNGTIPSSLGSLTTEDSRARVVL